MLMPVIDGKEIDDQTLGHIGRIVGDRVSKMAAERGWTQGQIAQNMQPKRSQGTISMIMRGGIVDPPISTLIGLARVFNVTLDQLVGFTPLPQAEMSPSASSDAPDIDLETLRLELLETDKRQLAAFQQVETMQGTLAQIQAALQKAGLLGEQSKRSKRRRAG